VWSTKKAEKQRLSAERKAEREAKKRAKENEKAASRLAQEEAKRKAIACTSEGTKKRMKNGAD